MVNINKHIKNFLDSFKVKRKFWETFAIDFIYLGVFGFLFTWFGNYVSNKSQEVMGGRTPEQIQSLLGTGQSQQLLQFANQMQSFLVIIILATTFLLLAGYLLFTYTRSLIWTNLLDLKKEKYWRWNVLILALIIPTSLMLLGYGILKIIFTLILNSLTTLSPTFYTRFTDIIESVVLIANNTFNFFLLLFVLSFVFLTYYSYTKKHKVWESIGEAFHLIKKYWSRLWRLLLLATLTALILTLILWPVRSILVTHSFMLNIVNLIISVLYLAWFRIYLIKTIS